MNSWKWLIGWKIYKKSSEIMKKVWEANVEFYSSVCWNIRHYLKKIKVSFFVNQRVIMVSYWSKFTLSKEILLNLAWSWRLKSLFRHSSISAVLISVIFDCNAVFNSIPFSYPLVKVIYTKYSKHCPYTVAHTLNVCAVK